MTILTITLSADFGLRQTDLVPFFFIIGVNPTGQEPVHFLCLEGRALTIEGRKGDCQMKGAAVGLREVDVG